MCAAPQAWAETLELETDTAVHPDYLVDSILRLTARLVAVVATLDGECADLSQVGVRLRNYIARELGPPRNRIALVASAFSVSETSVYQWRRKALQPPEQRATDRDWLYTYIRSHGTKRLRRENIEAAFVAQVRSDGTDDATPDEPLAPTTLASIRGRFETAMWLLRKADLVFATASRDPMYFVPDPEDSISALSGIVWMEIFERGSISPITRDELGESLSIGDKELDEALAYLVERNRIELIGDGGGSPAYRSNELYLPYDENAEEHSLEAAAIDHLRVVVETLIERFEQHAVVTSSYGEQRRAAMAELRESFNAKNGMVSWRFPLWEDHPRGSEILELGEKLVSIAHQLSLETRNLEGDSEAERVLYVGMHTRRTSTPEGVES